MRERDDLTFTMDEYRRRLAAVREVLERRNLDALIVTSPENIYYLSGYHTRGFYFLQALVVPTTGEPFIVARRFESDHVETHSWLDEARYYSDAEDAVTALRLALQEFGLAEGRLGYQKYSYFFRAGEQEQLFYATPQANYVDCTGVVDELRLVKSPEELEYVRQSARVTETAMRAGLDAVAAGVTENNVAAEIHASMINAGGEYPARSPSVVSGPRAVLGNASWEGRRLEEGDTVFMEVGGCVRRYHSVMMRTAFIGDPPEEVLQAEHLIDEAMKVSLEMIRPGVAAGDVDTQNRFILDRFARGSSHATRSGYSIGIAFAPHWGEGEAFSISAGESRPFQENMVLVLVPWLHMPGHFGLGMGETVVVTPDGCESQFSLERKLFRV